LPPRVSYEEDKVAYIKRIMTISKMMEDVERQPIGLPHDGAHFNESSPLRTAKKLLELREVGYIVPQYAITALLEEAQEEADELVNIKLLLNGDTNV